MSRRKERGCMGAAIAIIAVLSAILTGVWYTKKEYKSKQALIQQAISELPLFDKEAVAEDIAKSKGFEYPVPDVTMTPEEITSQAKNKAAELVSSKFALLVFAKKQSAILKKYRVAKVGDKISFVMRTTGENITGVLQGVFKDHKGRFVKVNFHEYRLPDIMEDFHYLFVPAVATKKTEKLLKDLRTGFKDKKSKFMLKTQAAITEKLYKKAGYIKDNGTWISNGEYVKNAVAEKEAAYQKNFKREKEKIYEKNKLFGLIDVDLIAADVDKKK
jgi:hypothetical protein